MDTLSIWIERHVSFQFNGRKVFHQNTYTICILAYNIIPCMTRYSFCTHKNTYTSPSCVYTYYVLLFLFQIEDRKKMKKKSIAADEQHTYLLFSWFIKVKVQRINGCLNKLQWFVDTVLHGRQNIINTHIHIQIIHAHIMLIVDIFTLLLCWHTIDGCRCRSHSVK